MSTPEPNSRRLDGSGMTGVVSAENVPETDETNDPRLPPTIDTAGVTPANDKEIVLGKLSTVITLDVNVTVSGGCEALRIKPVPAPKATSLKVPDK